MEKQIIASFESTHGPVIVKEVTNFRQYDRETGDVVEFVGMDGKQYIAFLKDIMLKNQKSLSVVTI